MDDTYEIDRDLLAACAILHRLDAELICAVAGCAPSRAAALLAGDMVEPGEGGPRLRAEVAAQALARLRAERPADEIALHTRAFAAYLAKLERSPLAARSPDDEDDCLRHLDALFILVGTQMDWQTILNHALAVRAAGVAQPRHRQRLDLYEGYVAIRTQEYERGERILAGLLAQDIVDADVRIKALKGLADDSFYRSHYDQALAYYRRLYTAAEAAGDEIYQGLALLNMGLVYYDLEHYDQALDHCERSLPFFQARGDRVREAHTRYHTALYSLYLGRWNDAQAHGDRAAELFESLGLENYLGFLYWLRGYLQHILGDEAASEAFYLRALPLAESPQHGQPSLALDVWLHLGFLYHTQGQWAAALDHYDRALAIATQLDRQQRISLIHYRRGLALQSQGRRDDALAAYRAAIDGIEALGSLTKAEEVKISLFGTTPQLYEAIVLLCLELGHLAEAFHYVERARSRAFLDALAARPVPGEAEPRERPAALGAQNVTVADVQAHLPADALLIEYFTSGVLPRGEHLLNSIPAANVRLRAHLTLPPRVIMFAITRERFEVRPLDLNPNPLRPPIGDHYPGRHLLHGRLPQHLYERLIAPAADLLRGRGILYLVPHGPLHYVPFTALRSAGGQYLLDADGPALAHAPSATILVRSCLDRPPARGADMLAIGFDDPHGAQPLRYAEVEARHVARMFGGSAWTGLEPKSQRLIAGAARARWLHIASHARFNPGDPLDSALYLGPDDALSARAIIHDLNLDVDLVTLSSCTSGVTHVVPGDELLGLQRALLYAGAPTVVCTRWEARDLAALLVMDYFYAGLRHGRLPAVALRDAQVALRELTSESLTELFGRWRAEGSELGAVLGAPADALRDAQAAVRALAGPELAELLRQWRAESGELAAALDEGSSPGRGSAGDRPFADPVVWAPFMLVGRA